MNASVRCLFYLIMATCLFCCFHSTDAIRVMTFNIRYGTADDGSNSWEFRKALLLEILQKYQPDILGTQEALDFQIAEIKAACPRYRVLGRGRYEGIELPNRPHESLSGESCCIFFDSTKFALQEQGTFWHSDTPEIPGSMTWGNTLPRITTWGLFQFKGTTQKWVIMNTHYHWDEPYVTRATQLTIQKQKAIAGSLPTILLGDFNLSPESECHEFLCGRKKWGNQAGPFHDAWIAAKKSEQNAGTYHGFKGDRRDDRIDWILTTAGFKVQDIQIIHDHEQGRYPSDHFPVLATLQIKTGLFH